MKNAYLAVISSRVLRMGTFAVLAAVATAFLLAIGWHGASAARVTARSIATYADPRLAQIQSVLAAQALNDVTIRTAVDGSLSLTGWLPSGADLPRLKQRLSRYGLRYALTASDEVTRYLSEHLRELAINASVSYAGAGHFRVQGQGEAKEAFDLALTRIAQNLPAGAQLDAHYDWHESAIAPIEQPAPDVKAPARHLLTGIDAVVNTGKSSYLTAGSHYVFSGGTLRDGAIVQSITTDRVEVVRANEGAVVGAELPGAVKHEDIKRKR
jgi:hypothetical protein